MRQLAVDLDAVAFAQLIKLAGDFGRHGAAKHDRALLALVAAGRRSRRPVRGEDQAQDLEFAGRVGRHGRAGLKKK